MVVISQGTGRQSGELAAHGGDGSSKWCGGETDGGNVAVFVIVVKVHWSFWKLADSNVDPVDPDSIAIG